MAAIITVFIQGLLSFFSPCILPLVPLYFSYLAGGMYQVDEDGKMTYPRKKVMLHTICFILGIGFAFVLLGLGMTVIGHFFGSNKVWFTRIGGLIMIFFGLYQLGFFGKSMSLEQTKRLTFNMNGKTLGPMMALVLGFTFSFAWTPCVGPVLTSVLLMASSASSAWTGFALLGVYLAGFVLPFLSVGLCAGFFSETSKCDSVYRKNWRRAVDFDGDYDDYRLDERADKLSFIIWRHRIWR